MAQRVRAGSRESTAGRAPELSDPEPDRSGRTVRRPRGLPGTRAVVGGLLVAVAGVGMFAASSGTNPGPRKSYVVTSRPLPAGARLQASDLELVTMELDPGLRTHAFENREVLLGTTLVTPLAGGELVQASAVVARKGEATSRELSFTLERGRVSPGVKEGERVDLLATYGTGNDAFTSVVVRHALIVAIERPRSSSGDGGPSTVTVSVDDPTDALALAHATQLGKITLVRSTGAAPLPSVPPTYRAGRS